MQLDRWLFEQHCLGLHPPTLRFYRWSPIAISLGYHQRRYPERWQHLTWKGEPIDLVRRPTGGRAVLHQGELTYAVVTSGIGGNRMQAYQTLCEFLIAGCRSLGIQLQFGQAGRGYIHNPNCFGTATTADLVLPDGTKIIGSAQLRRGDAILQHGSIQLSLDPDLFYRVFETERPPLNVLPDPPIQALTEALTRAASQCFGVQFLHQPLAESEWQAVLAQETLRV
ncbi:lipoate--protein ligase family protein [Oculatella sp. LEGE 06141]|nr:lipoate--protein ligase family protein [Oculatella sp. LEGE 06141]